VYTLTGPQALSLHGVPALAVGLVLLSAFSVSSSSAPPVVNCIMIRFTIYYILYTSYTLYRVLFLDGICICMCICVIHYLRSYPPIVHRWCLALPCLTHRPKDPTHPPIPIMKSKLVKCSTVQYSTYSYLQLCCPLPTAQPYPGLPCLLPPATFRPVCSPCRPPWF